MGFSHVKQTRARKGHGRDEGREAARADARLEQEPYRVRVSERGHRRDEGREAARADGQLDVERCCATVV